MTELMAIPEPVDVAVNGFGRIGVLFTRVAIEGGIRRQHDFDVRAINSGGTHDPVDAGKRLDWDTVHGEFDNHLVAWDDESLSVAGSMVRAKIPIFAEGDRTKIDWTDFSDRLVVVESTGQCLTTEKAQDHLDGGAKKVIITAASKDQATTTIVRGFNDTAKTIESAGDVVAVSSCSTNCISPVLKILDEAFDLHKAQATVIHAVTNSQRGLDGRGADLVGRRSLVDNIIPTSTGASKEVARFFPELGFKARSYRVPVVDGSVARIRVDAKDSVDKDDVVEVLLEALAKPELDGIVSMRDGEMVSSRVIGKVFSSLIDTSSIETDRDETTGLTEISLDAWFDNEWAYANRVAEVAKMIGQTIR